MKLDEECKGCLFNSQMKKVEREQSDENKLKEFKDGVRRLCQTAPADYCAPLLTRFSNSKMIFMQAWLPPATRLKAL